MKGNVLALKFLMFHPDIMQYVIQTLLLFILFLYQEMLKNVTVAISGHTEEAIVKVPSDGICPVVQDSMNHVTKEGLLCDA